MPEARSSRRELRGAFYRQFWNQTTESSRSLDTVVRCLPNEAPPGPMTTQSSLSRTQQLLVASTLGLPVVPIVSEDHGGLVRRLERGVWGVGESVRRPSCKDYLAVDSKIFRDDVGGQC